MRLDLLVAVIWIVNETDMRFKRNENKVRS